MWAKNSIFQSLLLPALAGLFILLNGCAPKSQRVYKIITTQGPDSVTTPSEAQPVAIATEEFPSRSEKNPLPNPPAAENRSLAADSSAPIEPQPAPAWAQPAPEPITEQESPSNGTSPVASANNAVDYHVGPGDTLEIKIYQLEELEKESVLNAPVDPAGRVNLPVLNNVMVAGLTVEQVRADLARRLAKNYLRDPQVAVRVKDYGSKQIMVLGNVKAPGVLNLQADALRLLEVISLAGGIQGEAAPHVEVLRGAYSPGNMQMLPGRSGFYNNSGVLRETYPLARLFAQDGDKLNPLIFPGDVVQVPSGTDGFVYISGEVRQPGAKPFRRPLTVLQALSSAGDMTKIASDKKCKLIRLDPEGKENVIDVDVQKIRKGKAQNLVLAKNDTILIPIDPAKKFWDDVDKFFRRGISTGVDVTYDAGADMGIPTPGGSSY